MVMEEAEQNIRTEYAELSKQLQDPRIYSGPEGRQVAKRQSELQELVDLFDRRKRLRQQVRDTEAMVADAELGKMAREELSQLQQELAHTEEALEAALVPKDPRDDKHAILEIRAGTGGDEAALFAGDLYRMYSRYSERHNWKLELVSESPAEVGGFKEIIVKVNGEGAYGNLKYESGVHRVQRVPTTESGGRIHTSTATVAVLPEAEEADVDIDPPDLRIDFFRSSGPGGQSVNTTDSAVRITHEPTGITVSCQDEKSQHKNKAKAMEVLRSRLLAAKIQEEEAKQAQERRSQIGTGERSEKIRTYNFPQDRVTDHRINFSASNLSQILEGNIDHIINALQEHDLELRKQTT